MPSDSSKTVLLIGGAPLSGKSTLAKGLSEILGTPWVSTDDIRKWMEPLVRKEDYPDLFYSDGLDAEAFYKKYKTAQKVFELENRQGLDVQKGITAMIESFWWWDAFIIEGIAITPSYARLFQNSHKNLAVRSVFLIDRNRDSIWQRLTQRGLWGAAGTYPDYIKPIELEWTILFNHYYEAECAKHGFITHDITELEKLRAELIRQHS